jgi:hypothetical protein
VKSFIGAWQKVQYRRLLAITAEIVDAPSLAIFFFGSLTLLNLIVSALCT